MKKTLSALIIFLFLLSSIIPITLSNETNKVYTIHIDENGTLSGYVKDTSMNPIEGAKVSRMCSIRDMRELFILIMYLNTIEIQGI